MSDLHGPEDAADHPDVRALLAGLGPGTGADEPLPDDVAARLDETLAALVDERRGSEGRGADGRDAVPAVLSLDRARERRRRWATRLAAAATVAAIAGGIGVGIAQLGGSSSVGTASSQAGGAAGANAAGNPTASGTMHLAALPRLSSRHFHADARRLVASESTFRRNGTEKGGTTATQPGTASGSTSPEHERRPAASHQVLAACGHRAGLPTGARAIPVRLDGEPATVVVVPRADGVAQVTAYPCSGHRVLATTTVPR